MFKATTKAGTLQVDETVIRLVMPFHQVQWEVPKEKVTGFVKQSSLFVANLVIYGDNIYHAVESLPTKKAEELISLFLGVEVHVVPMGLKWYENISLLNYVATYKKGKEINDELVKAAKYGWHQADISTTAGHVNVGRTATAAVLTSGISLLAGAVSRSKDKITLSFSRELDWMKYV
jgi:hypothetical protein